MSSCRFCRAPLSHSVVNLSATPIANDLLKPEQLTDMEPTYPLHAMVCDQCWLVQLNTDAAADHIFSDDYVYFSSFSSSWLAHAKAYVTMMIKRYGLTADSQVIEVASNDGYLLQYFKERDIPVTGIEPSRSVADAALAKGIPTIVEFFNRDFAARHPELQADVIIANNVMAHVPQLNDFVAGFAPMLKPNGVVTIEFPHLLNLIQQCQFDTIYHEHYSYFSLLSVQKILAAHGLTVVDVEEFPTHGGSLRVYAMRADAPGAIRGSAVDNLLATERAAGLDTLKFYQDFADRVHNVKFQLLDFLITAKRAGKIVVGYGAPAKGNTLLNYCGVGREFIDYTVDLNPHKAGKYLPGSRLPILSPDEIIKTQPDYVLILPWNLAPEITKQLITRGGWSGKCVVPIPELKILN